ncbi:MAG: hypothetical protein RQ745_03125 [Longimicrobiales bacterium]|nr:hypothetical protein [Longimicrobiales bacterium]
MSFLRRSALGLTAGLLLLPSTSAPARAQTAHLTADHTSVLDYREIGPTRRSGRFVDIAVHPEEPRIFWIASASGHLWKTENHGTTFEIQFTDEEVFSIGDITVAPSNGEILYLGSGEPNNSRSSYWGDGVYKSTDGGATWEHKGLPESHHIGRIVVHPDNPDLVYVAALGHLYSENPERGLYRSRNGGDSWEEVLAPVVNGKTIGVVDVAMNPLTPDVLYATTFDKVRVPWSYDLGGPGSRVYKSTDGGDTWQMLEGGLPMGMLGRIGVDIYPENPDIVYLTIENANKPGMSDEERLQELLTHQSSRGMIGGEIYRSDDAGATWVKTNSDDEPIGGGPAYYYGQIRVDPNDPDRVFVLSVSTILSEDGGRSWDQRALGFGGDDHALWINPDDSNHMILGYDHGMGVTFDGGANWTHPDDQSLAQFYAVGYDMSYPYRIAGGLQDNGSHMAYHTNPGGAYLGFEDWETVGGGDGMYNVFETCTNRYLYNESQFGPLRRTDLWTGESVGIRMEDDALRFNWNAPIQVSPHDCDVVFHGANRLLRTTNRGETWEYASPDLTKSDPRTLATGKGGDGNIQYATITTFDQSDLDAEVIWVGTDDGNVQVTRDGGESWTLLNANIPNNPEYWVSRVEASHHRPGRAYVSYTGYRRDDFRPFVYMTDDYGESWTDISSNLPDGPINVIREHHQNPDLLFVGSEFQVWVSADRGTRWVSMKNEMPTQPVHDMQIHPRANDLIVATHGRGIYIADITPLAQLTPEVLASDVHLFEPESRVRWIGDDRGHESTHNFRGENEPAAIQVYYWMGRDAGTVTVEVYRGEMLVAEVDAEAGAGLQMASWDMQLRTERDAGEQARMRERFGGRLSEEQIRYIATDAPLGEYRFVLNVDGERRETRASILRDEWWMQRR